jgi:hypothetical protein
VRAVRSVFCWILRWAIIRWTVPDRLTLTIIPLGLLKISVADKNSSSTTLGLNGMLQALKQPSTRTLVRRLAWRKNRGPTDLDGGARLVSRSKRAGTYQLRERLVHLMICEVMLQNNPLSARRHINGSDDAL